MADTLHRYVWDVDSATWLGWRDTGIYSCKYWIRRWTRFSRIGRCTLIRMQTLKQFKDLSGFCVGSTCPRASIRCLAVLLPVSTRQCKNTLPYSGVVAKCCWIFDRFRFFLQWRSNDELLDVKQTEIISARIHSLPLYGTHQYKDEWRRALFRCSNLRSLGVDDIEVLSMVPSLSRLDQSITRHRFDRFQNLEFEPHLFRFIRPHRERHHFRATRWVEQSFA